MNKLDLPIGESSFRTIREWDFYYVDKTDHIFKLTRKPGYYFLSRPRRFGKTLLLDTMQELFEGNEKLFRGLHIHDRWDWTVSNPVVRLSFDGNYCNQTEIEKDVIEQFEMIERQNQLEPAVKSDSGPRRFRNIINRLYYTTGKKVVVLVDEYDKPILDMLGNQKQVKANRDYLHGVYGIIKGCAPYIRFVFVTGISMYSRVNLFSGLNNLKDISLDSRYATICGYTEADIDTVFAPELEGLDRDKIRHWYNGYNWLGEEKVYNPFDVLLLFDEGIFKPHWYRTGTPSYLYNLMAEGKLSTLELENFGMYEEELSSFKLESVSTNALLFQCGYLTIQRSEVRDDDLYYELDYPNHEVRLSLNRELLLAAGANLKEVFKLGESMAQLLADNDFEQFGIELKAFYAGFPNECYLHGDLGNYQGHYVSLLYAFFQSVGLSLRVEESTSHGRSDLVVLYAGQVFILEFKMAVDGDMEKAKDEAMGQIHDKRYAHKYLTGRQRIHLLSVACWRAKTQYSGD